MGYDLHRYLNSSLGKNLSLYSLVGAWLVIALTAYAHKEFKWPNILSQDPPLNLCSNFHFPNSVPIKSSDKGFSKIKLSVLLAIAKLPCIFFKGLIDALV